VRALEEDPRGALRDRGVLSADDAGQGHGSAGVGDDQGVGTQDVLAAVEAHQLLFRMGVAHPDAALLQGLPVEGVEGMTELQEHVVGRVHHVVDRPDADRLEPLGHPRRRRPHLESHELTAEVAQAALGGLHLDVQGRAFPAHLRGGRTLQGQAETGRQFPGHPVVGQKVRAVGRDFDVQDPIFGRDQGGDVLADLRILPQNQDPVRVGRQPQLLGGAQHPLGLGASDDGALDDAAARQRGPDASQRDPLAHLDVLGPADDQDLLRAVRHLAQRQAVGVGVPCDLQDLAHYHAGDAGASMLDGRDLEAQKQQTLRQVPRTDGQLHKFPKPVVRNLHGSGQRVRGIK